MRTSWWRRKCEAALRRRTLLVLSPPSLAQARHLRIPLLTQPSQGQRPCNLLVQMWRRRPLAQMHRKRPSTDSLTLKC